MRVPSILLGGLLLLTLSGCADDDADTGTDSLDAGSDTAATPRANPVDPAEPGDDAPTNQTAALETVPVQFDGNLGTLVFACETQTLHSCHGTIVTGGDSQMDHEQAGASLVGIQLVMEWTAPTPATEVLGLRIYHGDDFRHFVEGTSPLSVDLTDLDLPLGEDRLYVDVYNAEGVVSNPPLYAYASVDQEFTIEGGLTLRSDA